MTYSVVMNLLKELAGELRATKPQIKIDGGEL